MRRERKEMEIRKKRGMDREGREFEEGKEAGEGRRD
jgi:hypothetical protein